MLLTKRIDKLINKLAQYLISHQWTLVAAESCTGGALAANLTSCSGSSNWFEASVVSYSEHAKVSLLGVSEDTLIMHGAVSEDCALEMVRGVRLSKDNFAVALTGFAGPTGGSIQYPIGTVFIAWQTPNSKASCQQFIFLGNRQEVVLQAVYQAIKGCVLNSLQQDSYQEMRFFFAIILEERHVQDILYHHALQSGFEVQQLEPVGNLHITLGFIGKATQADILQWKTKAAIFAQQSRDFAIECDRLEYWRNSDAFVYLLKDGSEDLKKLSQLLTQDKFTPHVTISKRCGVIPDKIQLSPLNLALTVKSFSLMASLDGLIYIEQKKWFLNKEIK